MAPRNTWTKTSASFDCGIVTITQTTRRPAHLYLAITSRVPSQSFSMSFPDDNNPPHRRNYRFITERIVEQNEPGDTTQHTFTFVWPSTGPLFWCIASDSFNPQLLTSKSPVYAYYLAVQDMLFQERWKVPSATRQLPPGWGAFGTDEYEVRPGQLSIWLASGGTSVRHSFAIPIAPPLGCNTFLHIEGAAFYPEETRIFQQAVIHLLFNGGFNAGGYDRAYYLHVNECNATNVSVTATTLNKSGRFFNLMWNLSAIAQDETANCDSPITPYNGGNLTEIQFNLNAAGPIQGPPCQLTIDALSIYTVQSTLHDVSSAWRKMRLSPSPRPTPHSIPYLPGGRGPGYGAIHSLPTWPTKVPEYLWEQIWRIQ